MGAIYTSGLRSTPSAVSFNDITSRSSPMANPIPGAAGPPSASDKSVVAPSAEDRVLRSQRAVREFESCTRVVVEAAHQAVVERESNPTLVRISCTASKCLRRIFAEELRDARQRFDDWLILRHFAVEHAQRIRHRAALAVVAHLSRPPAPTPCAMLR